MKASSGSGPGIEQQQKKKKRASRALESSERYCESHAVVVVMIFPGKDASSRGTGEDSILSFMRFVAYDDCSLSLSPLR